jgi:hypothetical protein
MQGWLGMHTVDQKDFFKRKKFAPVGDPKRIIGTEFCARKMLYTVQKEYERVIPCKVDAIIQDHITL